MMRIRFSHWKTPLFLLFLAGISFAPLIPWLGLYWDDWPSFWFLHQLGPRGFRQVFASDRPFLGMLFTLSTWLVGERLLGWHLFALLARWLAGVAFWRLMLAIWPDHQRQAAWAAILFMVYPGFSQQPIAVTYSHAWLILAAFLASLEAFVRALRKPAESWPLILLALLLAAFAMFSTEYFYTLELLRPVIAWLILGTTNPQPMQRLRRTVLRWLPFLTLMLLFFIWRVFLHEFPRGEITEPAQLLANPLSALASLAARIGEDVYEAALLAWALPLRRLLQADFRLTTTTAFLGIALLAALATGFYLYRLQRQRQNHEHEAGAWAKQALPLGALALFVAGGPFWMTNLPIRLEFPFDRFTLAFIPGGSLALVALLEFVPRARLPKIIVIAALAGLAVNFHLDNANRYRMEWNLQKAFFWQLSWRAPSIKPGTALMTAHLPFLTCSDNSLTAPLNWIYASSPPQAELSYLMFDIQARRGNNPPPLEKGQPIRQFYRSLSFNGSTSQALALTFKPPGCLKILDPAYDVNHPNQPHPLDRALPLSDPGNIAVAAPPAVLPAALFGAQPAPDWCYYFEQAELARQAGNWRRVAELGDQALALQPRLYPVNAPELTPYIGAYAHIGQWQKAIWLSGLAFKTARNTRSMLCEMWARIEAQTAPETARDAALQAVRADLGCPPR